MPDQIPNEPEVRADEPELSDEALEQVAGGCAVDQSVILMPPPPVRVGDF